MHSDYVGPYATLVDLVQSEYHWTDDVVLSLPLSRVVQIRDAIFIRHQAEMFSRHREIEWQTRHLGIVEIMTSQGDQRWKKKMLKIISKWDMDARPETTSTDTEHVEQLSEAEIEAMWERGAHEAAASNAHKPGVAALRLR